MAERLRFPPLAREMAAEFAGTMILILFGTAVVAQVVAGSGLTDGGLGDHDSITWAWGIGVTLGVYVSARMTGGHINPAVTIALAVFKRFSWSKVAPYVLAQTLGAFVAALIVRWNYSEVLAAFDPATRSRPRPCSPPCPETATRRCRSICGAVSATRSSAPRSCCSWSWRSPICATIRRWPISLP